MDASRKATLSNLIAEAGVTIMQNKRKEDKDEVEDVVVVVVMAEDSMFLTTVQESLGNWTFLSSALKAMTLKN